MVIAAIEDVVDSGATNMLDRPMVVAIVRALGCDEAADWIEAHRTDYAEGLFRGFLAEEGAGGGE